MRITVTLALLAPLSLVACSDTKDPSDNLTALPETEGTASTADSMSDTGTASMSGTGNQSASDSATSTGKPPDPTGGPVTTITTSGPTSDPSTDPTVGPTSDPTSATSTTGDPGDPYEQARQLCVDIINMYRGTLGLPPYARWTDAESCSDAEAAADGQSGTPHGAFGQCGEWAQNECPGWPSPAERSLPGCLEQMWAEGPGEDFNEHGHYINMSSEQYTKVACGFADAGGGEMWMVQNFQ